MAMFVLVHGACHGAWCWERVVPLLEAEGHRVLAPDLPGMGEDQTPQETVTAELWTEFLADLVRRQDEPVVLVGHSRAGMQISAVAEAAPEGVRRLVYLAAFVPQDGRTNLDLALAFCSGEMLSAAGQLQHSEPAAFPADIARAIFYNTTEEEWVARAASKLGREPMRPTMAPARLTAERFGRVSKAYIECLDDHALPIDSQRGMRAHADFETVLQLPTDHSPFYSAPAALAAALAQLAD